MCSDGVHNYIAVPIYGIISNYHAHLPSALGLQCKINIKMPHPPKFSFHLILFSACCLYAMLKSYEEPGDHY